MNTETNTSQDKNLNTNTIECSGEHFGEHSGEHFGEHFGERFGRPAFLTRFFGWGSLFILVAFLSNNILQVGFDFSHLSGVPQSSQDWLQFAFYCMAILMALLFVLKTPNHALRWEARRITAFNTWVIRAAFFVVLLIGIVDVVIAFLRVEDFLDGSSYLSRQLRQSQWVGPYIHIPLICIGMVMACFSRTLGFPWLALMIVAAELLIVITRFIFSYEQALMSDLVRYWYAALFLFSSAYTMIEEGHVRVDVFYAQFGRTTKGFCNALGTILLGMVTAWTVILIGFGGKQSIINAAVANFEISQSGIAGMFVKYQMAGFLGIFAITMLIQFVSYLFESVADWRDESGHVEHKGPSH